ncbi:hypothetical protein F7725_021098 [Dissostichus mawsoni]|uniref:Eosinophil peroxidase n=1 Tax=Dissostichus mawsoni TaxID=36200 RepID=A0A7J5YF70_DISMA|nr:hypothetical protein F7725_021098 [Dissostichus mawsoni]
MFGQWNDHDLTFTPFSPSIRSFSNGINCDESCEKPSHAYPSRLIPPGDPRLPTGRNSCIPAFRSAPVCGSGYSAYNFGGEPNKREQINALTAFLDLGQVYGSEEQLAKSLRDPDSDGGLLRVNTEFRDNRRELLPFNPMQVNMCALAIGSPTTPTPERCPVSSQVTRVDENIALTSIHTMFMREHNRLARQLKSINRSGTARRSTRRPAKSWGLTHSCLCSGTICLTLWVLIMRRQLGRYPGYNANVDPSIANVFATAAYRFAHLAIQPVIPVWMKTKGELPLSQRAFVEAFFTPWRVVFEAEHSGSHDGGRSEGALVPVCDDLALDLGSLNMRGGVTTACLVHPSL